MVDYVLRGNGIESILRTASKNLHLALWQMCKILASSEYLLRCLVVLKQVDSLKGVKDSRSPLV